jgi:hypothetical protein
VETETIDVAEPEGRGLWFRRILTVLWRPAEVFVALRDDSDDAADERQEPILLIILLSGMAWVLATSFAGTLLDATHPDQLPLDRGLIPAWAFLGGFAIQNVVYWAGGALLLFGLKATDSTADYRQARHVFGYAMAPLAVSILLVPLRLLLFGADIFRSGGSDAGAGSAVFAALELGFVAWSVALLVIGVRALHDWPWSTALKGVAVALVVPAAAIAVSLVR